MTRYARPLLWLVALGLALLAPARPCAAAEDKSAVSPTHLKLPKGPGSLGGIGENAEPNLSMGLVTYGVPIAVPAGYAGLTPSVGLEYSSGSGSSVVGIGWSLPVPSIERMTSRGLPEYAAADRFAAGSGDELVRVDDAAGVYRARFEGAFVRYTWVDEEGDGRAGFWIAEYPDGRVGYFGADSTGVVVPEARMEGDLGVFRYCLVELLDTLGHRVRYDYQKPAGTPLLQRVAYVWQGEEPRYEVDFSYEERPDAISDAKPGFETRLTQRLAEVLVLSRGEQLRRYELSYDETPGLSRLARVLWFGLTDAAGPHPVSFTFSYSGGLGQSCDDAACAKPEVHTLDGGSGVDFVTNAADWVDLNGDALPDVVDTQGARHTVHLNERLIAGDAVTERLSEPTTSEGGALDLRAQSVRMLDLDGNGFADMVDAVTGYVLFNSGTGDWSPEERIDTLDLPDLSLDADARLVDMDNDGCIDVLHCDASAAWYWKSGCDGTFTRVEEDVVSVGSGFSEDALQLADMNGDGLQDLVLVGPSTVAFWLNLGRGRWSGQHTMSDVPEQVEVGYRLIDLSGDGLADLVRVAGVEVSYSLNRNAATFAPLASIAASATLPIPELVDTTSLRFADMNGSGSTDVVWADSSGHITYLELFPERPNLLSGISNGIGKQIAIEYGSSADHMARDGGPSAWTLRLPHPMLTVDRIRTWEEHGNVEQIQTFRYHDGYYDPIEHQFRGFAAVEAMTAGDDTSEPRRTRHEFNVGFDDQGLPDPYYKGLPVRQAVYSGSPERAIEETQSSYRPCALAGVPDTEPAVRFICQQGTTRTLREGRPAAEAAMLAERYEYDGYGNRTLTEKQGVTERGGGGCGECTGANGDFGDPCGQDCSGDEAFTKTTFIPPSNAGGRWMLGKPESTRTYGVESSQNFTEERYYYDDKALGELAEGLLTKTTARKNTSGELVTTLSTAYDDNGAPVKLTDANGHARYLGYDADSLLVVSETVELEDRELRMEVDYDPVLDAVTASSAWSLGDRDESRVTRYAYDGFGRLVGIAAPGDSLEAPTQEFEYSLESPTSSISTRRRSSRGGSLDLERIQCFDAMGRELQTRTLVAEGQYQVSGYAEYDAAGQARRAYYAHQGTTGACANGPPEEVPFVTTKYDGTGRALSVEFPAATADDTTSRSETYYLPLETRVFDEEDTASESPHVGTPLVTRVDGLGRTVEHHRYLSPDEDVPLRLVYDEHGNLRGYVDVAGNRKTQEYDLLGRVKSVADPDSGVTSFEYDSVGNVTAETDARDIKIRRTFDWANRLLAEWKDGDRDNTEIKYQYDRLDDCAACTYAEGVPVSVQFPLSGDSPPLGIDRFGYDERGQQTHFQRTLGSRAFAFETDYDNAGRVVAKRYPAELSLTFGYDGADRLKVVPGHVERVDYDERGLTEALALANGAETTYAHDNRLRLARLDTVLPSEDALQAYAYTRDRVGNILTIEDESALAGEPSQNARYSYDSWYRLTGAVLDEGRDAEETLSYRYDEIDNILSKTSNLEDNSREHVGDYTYGQHGAGPHAVTTAGPHTYGYGPAGHLATKDDDSYTYEWDFLGRMGRARHDGAELASFSYGPSFDRVKKVEQGQTTYYVTPEFEVRDGIATLYVVVGSQRIAKIEVVDPDATGLPDLAPAHLGSGTAEPEPDGIITAGDPWIARANVVDVFDLAEPQTNAVVTELLAAAARRTLAAVEPESLKVTFFHYDHLGSLVAVTDADGAVVERRAQYPYGVDRTATVPLEGEYLFTGKETDRSTGLVYFGARYLDPVVGRWVSQDPLFVVLTRAEDPQMWNLRAFGRNNPVANLDPNGEFVETAWDVFNIGVGVASLVADIREGNYRAAALDGLGVVLDSAAAALPFVPGGAGTAIKAVRATKVVVERADAVKTVVTGKDLAGREVGVLGRTMAAANLFLGSRRPSAADPPKASLAGKVQPKGPDFDKARVEAFRKAGMTDPSKIEFSKMDPVTGTVVEFKGPGGAKVGYDGPHPNSPGAFHDQQHISAQSAGKRGAGGAIRENIPYSGPQHPSRPSE